MSMKTTAVTAAGVLMLVVGVNQALAPRTPQQLNDQRQQQQWQDLSDADATSKDGMRERAQDGMRTENQRRLTPVEPRPRNPVPRLRIRIP